MLWTSHAGPSPPPGPSSGRRGEYASPGLADLLAAAAVNEESHRARDLGPVHGSTLQVLAARHLEVHVAALEPSPSGSVPLPDYPDASFAAILGWDYLVRVRPPRRAPLAEALGRWLSPGGVLLLIQPVPGTRSPRTHRFRVLDASRLEYEPLGPIPPRSVPSTREVLAMFPALQCNGARILRHGAHEFLLRSPRAGA